MEQAPTSTSNALIVHQGEEQTLAAFDAAAVPGLPWLFVGSLSAAECAAHCLQPRITRVLTVAKGLPVSSISNSTIQRVQVDLDDHPQAELWPVLETCFAVLDDAAAEYQTHLENNNNNKAAPALLVHCASGISRSVSIVLAWMLVRLSSNGELEELLRRVRQEREAANPNAGFWAQLKVLERHCGAAASDNNPITAAQQEWEHMNREERLIHVSKRRQVAHEIHAQVDNFEVKVQQLRAKSQLAPQSVGSLKSEGATLSDRLDQNASQRLGIPENRVTRIMFQSARSKLERLMVLLESEKDE